VETSRPLIEAGRHEIVVDVSPEPVLLDADSTRLVQVFANILNNAARYSAAGGRIRVSAERHGGDVLVHVRDTGYGIPPDRLPHIFELFSQIHHPLQKSEDGLGIGLALVQRLVALHGGSVDARSDGAGQGSEFIVRLPAVPEAVRYN